MSEDMYTIGDLARITGFSKGTLRLYDKKQVLKASTRNNDNNYRLYSEQDAIIAIMIRELKNRGFSISEIKHLQESQDLQTTRQALNKKTRALERAIEQMQMQLEYMHTTQKIMQEASRWYDEISEKGHSEMIVDVMPQISVVYERKTCYFNAKKLFWERYNDVQQLRAKKKLTVSGPFTAVFHGNYFNQFFFDEGDLEVYIPICEQEKVGPNIRTVGGYLRASMIYLGWYTELLPTYVELVKQIEKGGYRISGPAHEEYLIEFSYGVKHKQYVTKIFFPIEKL